MPRIFITYTLLSLFFIFSCTKESTSTDIDSSPSDDLSIPEPNNIVFIEEAVLHNSSLLHNILNLVSQEVFEIDLDDVSRYKMTYSTSDLNQNPITASGVLFLPQNKKPEGIIFLQHSTIQSNDAAPSNSVIGVNEYTVGALYAASGYLVLMPDHIGYGISYDQVHPYELKNAYTISSYDFLLAGHSFLKEQKLDIPDELILVGYSNGAYASLSLHQFLENETEFNVNATYSGGGAYDKSAFSKSILMEKQELSFMGTYLWVLDVYNRNYSNLNRSWDNYIQEPYATKIDALGPLKSAVPDSLINLNPQLLFQPTFIKGIIMESDQVFISRLEDNNVSNWSPKAPIYLFHGSEDDFVFPINSENTFESLLKNGATINYTVLEGKNHIEAVIPFFTQVLTRLGEP